jgi:thiamine transport system permease protein
VDAGGAALTRSHLAGTGSSSERPRLSPWAIAALAAPPALFVAVLYAWPFATLVARVVRWNVVVATWHRPGLAEVVWFTAWQALASTVATLVIGLPVAWVIARWSFPGRRALQTLVTVPFLLPTVVVGAAFVALLPTGWRSSALAIVAAHVFFNVAVVVRVVGATWSRLSYDLTGAGATLGASPAAVFRRVTLPLLAPSIAAAAGIVALFTFTSFGVVQVLGGPGRATVEVEIARRALQLGDVGGAAVLAVAQVLALGAMVVWSTRTQRRTTPSALQLQGPRRPRGLRERAPVALVALTAATGVLAPIVVMVAASFRPGGHWSARAWRTLGGTSTGRPGASLGVQPWAAVATSLRVAAAATSVSVVIGGLGAFAIAAMGRRGRWLEVGTVLPLATSAVTLGLGMLITFDHPPVDWRAEPWLVPLGHALVAIPFVIRTVLPVLRAQPPGWAQAAATLGVGPGRAWWRLDVCLARRPLVVAAGFAAAVSLGEFGATTFLTRSGHETLPVAIARLLGRAGAVPRAQAFALASLLAVVTATLLVGLDLLDHGGQRDRLQTATGTSSSTVRSTGGTA